MFVCLTDQAPESLGGDESLALLVVHPEGVLQLLLHRLHVGVLDQEGGAQLAEFTWTAVDLGLFLKEGNEGPLFEIGRDWPLQRNERFHFTQILGILAKSL